jgi:hypothetical protein
MASLPTSNATKNAAAYCKDVAACSTLIQHSSTSPARVASGAVACHVEFAEVQLELLSTVALQFLLAACSSTSASAIEGPAQQRSKHAHTSVALQLQGYSYLK